MSELKPCPFCGETPETNGQLVQCYKMPCDARRFPMPIDSWNTRPIEDALKARIAKLEAEVAELKPFRDGYDPEEVFPPEGEWVWLRDCDDEINPVQYDHKAGIYWNYETNVDGEPFRYWESNNGDLRRWYPIWKLPEAQK